MFKKIQTFCYFQLIGHGRHSGHLATIREGPQEISFGIQPASPFNSRTGTTTGVMKSQMSWALSDAWKSEVTTESGTTSNARPRGDTSARDS
jgi:hypothetical protein